MNPPGPGFGGPVALVPGELRGYRRFRLTGGALHPAVHTAAGPWSGRVEHAICMSGTEHTPPDPGCGCGLYGWYHPADARADSGFGDVTAVIAGRGRVILGDYGFRAEAARVEAIALPGPRAGGRSSSSDARVLAARYPQARIYRSNRRMVRDHPPDDLTELGITVAPSAASRYRRAALVVWLGGVLALYSIAVLSRGGVRHPAPVVWGAALTAFLLWQAALVRLTAASVAPGTGKARPATADRAFPT